MSRFTTTVRIVLSCLFASNLCAHAQSGIRITGTFVDETTAEPLGFATVSLTPGGSSKVYKYALTTDEGKVSIDGVKAGSYTIKVELMGYKPYTKNLTVKSTVDLGTVKVTPDNEVLDAAVATAIGNPIIIKKDTIEYNASAFKTTDNDVLEDLLKKLPGVEVGDDGSISVNGETISKITIDGKTFFLDDPQLASKNLPAKIINKVKVVEKKSEQAEFTGIDDGEEETVIDLSINPGMMKGAFGNVMGGGGHDIPSVSSEYDDARFQGAAFLGNFTDNQQLSLILNANNTNNRGFNDLAGNMMGNMRGGGGGMGRGNGGMGRQNGIVTSYMAGANGAWDLFDDKMDLGGNYVFTGNEADVKENSTKTTYLDGKNLIYEQPDGVSLTNSYGHRFGMRLDHKFSDNTSILFQPQVNFGNGDYLETSKYTSSYDYLDGNGAQKINEGFSLSNGDNKNVSTDGFLLLRQRLGIPGRTITANVRYSFSNNEINGLNQSLTTSYDGGAPSDSVINQRFNTNSKAASLSGRLTYTEPLGNSLYLEANYEYGWNKSTSGKDTYDSGIGYVLDRDNYDLSYVNGGEVFNSTYSNSVENEYVRQSMGANLSYQREKLRAQLGFSAKPTKTHNSTQRGSGYSIDTTFTVWNFAPQAMLWGDFTDNFNAHMFYRGNSSQPSVSQLMPVPDNTDPLNVSFGNPTLSPYFSHNLMGDVRLSDKKTFSSLNVRFNGSIVQNPIVSAIWYGSNGAQYSMPFNGRNSGSYGVNLFGSTQLGKRFTLSDMTRVSGSKSSSYVGSNIDMTPYYKDGEMDYTSFLGKYHDIDNHSEFDRNDIRSLSIVERLRLTYKLDNLTVMASGRTRYSHSWYTISTATATATFNNQLGSEIDWTVDRIGFTLKGEFNYNWYNGYTTPQEDEFILNAEIEKQAFKNKVTLALKCYDILEQAKNLNITDANNYHQETWNNTLGRYIIFSLTYRFGTFDKSKMRGGPGGGSGMRMGPPPMR